MQMVWTGGLNVAEGVADGKGFGFKANRFTAVAGGPGGVDIDFDRFFGIVVLQVE